MSSSDAMKAAPVAAGCDLRIDEELAALIHFNSKIQPIFQDKIVATIKKNGRDEYRIAIREFRGHRLVDLRIYASNGCDFAPTARGLTIKPQNLRAVIEGLEAAEIIAKQEGLL